MKPVLLGYIKKNGTIIDIFKPKLRKNVGQVFVDDEKGVVRIRLQEEDKFEDKLDKLKSKEVQIMLFDEFLRVTNNQKQGNSALTTFFGKK